MPAGSGLESSRKDELQSNSTWLHTHDAGIELGRFHRQVLYLNLDLGTYRRQLDTIGVYENTTIGYIPRLHNKLANRWMFEFDTSTQLGAHMAAAVTASFQFSHRYTPVALMPGQVSN